MSNGVCNFDIPVQVNSEGKGSKLNDPSQEDVDMALNIKIKEVNRNNNFYHYSFLIYDEPMDANGVGNYFHFGGKIYRR